MKLSALSGHIHMSEVEDTFAVCHIFPTIGLITGRVSYTLAKSQSVTHTSPDRPIGIARKEAGVMYRCCYLFTVICQVKHRFHILYRRTYFLGSAVVFCVVYSTPIYQTSTQARTSLSCNQKSVILPYLFNSTWLLNILNLLKIDLLARIQRY